MFYISKCFCFFSNVRISSPVQREDDMRVRENTWLEDKQLSTHEAEQQKARRGFSSRFRCKPHDMRVTWGEERVEGRGSRHRANSRKGRTF